MKILFLFLFFLILLNAQTAELVSIFPSQIEGIAIPNASYVDSTHRIIRGMSPVQWIEDLSKLNVTDVLIFKRQVEKEVDEEIKMLKGLGYNHRYIPFMWKNINDYGLACRQVLEALNVLVDVHKSNERVLYFHCTVGEDRTGLLAGLWEMLIDQKDMKTAFSEQMCRNGYGEGNPKKPDKVVKAIKKSLTPLYMKIAKLIEDGQITLDKIDHSVCENLPDTSSIPLLVCRQII